MERHNLLPVHVYGLTKTYGPIMKCYPLPEWQQMPEETKFQKMARQGHGHISSLPCRVIQVSQDEAGLWTSPRGLVDVAKDGREIGEVVFRGNICAKGYHKDAIATQKLFPGGVLHSGDLAMQHPDGAVQILDRAKDIIISGGENISSLVLETVLVTHPYILEAACVATKNEKWGEMPKAYVTLVRPLKNTITGRQIAEWMSRQTGISRFMVPKGVEIVDELPKTSTGKVRKNLLREWARGENTPL